MKRIISVIAILCSLGTINVFAESDSSSDWKAIGEQGSKLLKETGKFFQNITKQAGETIKNGVTELSTVQCYGTWFYATKEGVKTRIIVGEDGSFKFIQKKGLESQWVEGTCSGTAHILNVKAKSIGHKTFFKKEEKSVDTPILLTYLVSQDKGTCNFAISGATKLLDDTDFTQGIDFTREK